MKRDSNDRISGSLTANVSVSDNLFTVDTRNYVFVRNRCAKFRLCAQQICQIPYLCATDIPNSVFVCVKYAKFWHIIASLLSRPTNAQYTHTHTHTHTHINVYINNISYIVSTATCFDEPHNLQGVLSFWFASNFRVLSLYQLTAHSVL